MGYAYSVDETLVRAIEDQHFLRFWYNGGFRTVAPHAYGRGSKGHDLLRGYQIEGYSESGETAGWKLFIASGPEKMSNLVMLDETFSGPYPGYRPGDRAMTVIYAQL